MTEQDKAKLTKLRVWGQWTLLLGLVVAGALWFFGLNEVSLALCIAFSALLLAIHYYFYDAINSASYLSTEEKRALILSMWLFSPIAMVEFWVKARKRAAASS